MAFERIACEKRGDGIAVLRLNRPARLNAIDGRVLEELWEAVDDIDRDEGIRVFLLCGAPRSDGRPCFSAGFDLKSVAEGVPLDPHLGARLTDRIDDLLTPSIAAVDGVCSTGGAELALACDFRLVGEQLQLSDWHLKHLGTGLGQWGAGARWPRLVGVQKAKEILLTGKVVGAEEAVRIGFAAERHPSERLMDAALEMAAAIAAMSRSGVRMCLAHLDHSLDMSRESALRHALQLPALFGVDVAIEGKADAVLGGVRARRRPAER